MSVWLAVLLEVLAQELPAILKVVVAWFKDWIDSHKNGQEDLPIVVGDAPDVVKQKVLEYFSKMIEQIDMPILKRLMLRVLPFISDDVIDKLWDRVFAAQAGGRSAQSFRGFGAKPKLSGADKAAYLTKLNATTKAIEEDVREAMLVKG
jgi:hypothetical protein